jgi:DNA polymerase (family X)
MDEGVTSTLVNDQELHIQYPMQPLLRIHLAAEDQYVQRLWDTTGSDEFLQAFRARYTMPAAPADEEAVFAANGLSYIPAPRRENAGILDLSAAGVLEEALTTKDVRGIIHSHSKWSDGAQTIEEMARTAIEMGFEYLVISDHSQSAFYANGLTPERVAAQHQEIDALNRKLAPFRIFKSIESDILNDGSLDYSPSVLASFDLVIASVHSNLKMTEEKAMERVLAAIRNPYTTILGHPTGRLLLSRPGYPLNFDMVIGECVKHSVVIEINAHPRRLDLDWRCIESARKAGAILSVDPDAHVTDGFRDIRYGVMAAQKGGLTAAGNLSSYSLEEMVRFVEKRKSDLVGNA